MKKILMIAIFLCFTSNSFADHEVECGGVDGTVGEPIEHIENAYGGVDHT